MGNQEKMDDKNDMNYKFNNFFTNNKIYAKGFNDSNLDDDEYFFSNTIGKIEMENYLKVSIERYIMTGDTEVVAETYSLKPCKNVLPNYGKYSELLNTKKMDYAYCFDVNDNPNWEQFIELEGEYFNDSEIEMFSQGIDLSSHSIAFSNALKNFYIEKTEESKKEIEKNDEGKIQELEIEESLT